MHGWFIYVACSRAGTATATEPISSRICVHFFRGALSPLLVQEFAVGSARPPVRAAPASGARRAMGLQQCVGLLFKENAHHQLWLFSFVRSTERFHMPLPRSEPCRMAERQT